MIEVSCLGILCADILTGPITDLPDKGKLSTVKGLVLKTGGCAANAAIDLARLGVNAAILGKVGEDGFAQFIRDSLVREGVNVNGLKLESGINTSASIVLIDQQGERSILHCLGSNAELTKEDLDLNIIKQSRILFVGGALLMPKFDGMDTAEVLKTAQQWGVATVMDTAWDSTGQWLSKLEPCLQYLDVFMPSYDEAQMLSSCSEPLEMAAFFLAKGVKTAVIKLGEKGCLIMIRGGEVHEIPAYSNIPVIDTSGAGDAFCAGFLTGMINRWSAPECGRFANAVGAHCIMQIGASEGVKSLEEVLQFMGEQEKKSQLERDSNKY